MGKKKSNHEIDVYFVGNNTEEVTGSMIYIENKELDYSILLECGLVQYSDTKKAFEKNMQKLPIKAKNIDYCFVNHIHGDHILNLPKLYAENFNGKIIAPQDSGNLATLMLKDGYKIMYKDAEMLTKRYKKEYKPYYSENDVDMVLDNMYEYEIGKIHRLDDNVSFQFINAGHIIRSCQLILYLRKSNGQIMKLGYTSDLGSTLYGDKAFVEKFEQISKCHLLIGESTYGEKERNKKINSKQREKDIYKLQELIKETITNKGRLIIPVFALDRSTQVLKVIYDICQANKGDKIFDNLQVVLDSPLAVNLTMETQKILTKDKEKFDEMLDWSNLRLIKEYNEHKACLNDTSPKVILSSSGMATQGRIKEYLKSVIGDSKSIIVICGYCAEGSLSYKIKNSDEQKYISIDGKAYRNNAKCYILTSFSSHMTHDQLVSYYSQIQTDKICLVHGNKQAKMDLKADLEAKLSEQAKTTKVIIPTKSTVCHL